jgi:hypothetical protein
MEVPGAACEAVSRRQQVAKLHCCLQKLLHVSSLRSLVARKVAQRVPRLDCRWAGRHGVLVIENYVRRRWCLGRSLE